MSRHRKCWKVRVLIGDRVHRIDGEGELAREEAESPGVVAIVLGADVVWPRGDPVVVEIEAREDPRVRGEFHPVGILDRIGPVLGHRQIVVLEQVDGDIADVEVELVDQQHVGSDALDYLGHGLGLNVGGGRKVGDQLTLCGPVERGVEGGEADLPL